MMMILTFIKKSFFEVLQFRAKRVKDKSDVAPQFIFQVVQVHRCPFRQLNLSGENPDKPPLCGVGLATMSLAEGKVKPHFGGSKDGKELVNFVCSPNRKNL